MGINYVGDVGYGNAGYKISLGGTNKHIFAAKLGVDIGGLLTVPRWHQKTAAKKRCGYSYQGSGLEPVESLTFLYTLRVTKVI